MNKIILISLFIISILVSMLVYLKNNEEIYYNTKYKTHSLESAYQEPLMWRILGLQKRLKFEEAKNLENNLYRYQIRSEGEHEYLLSLLDLKDKKPKSEVNLLELIKNLDSEPASIKSLTNGAFLIAAWVHVNLKKNTIAPILSNKERDSILNYSNNSSEFAYSKEFIMTHHSGTLMCWDLFKVSNLLKIISNNQNLISRKEKLKKELASILNLHTYAFTDLNNFIPCLQVLVEENENYPEISSELHNAILKYLLPLLDHTDIDDCMGSRKYLSYPRVNPNNKCRNNFVRLDTNAWLFHILSKVSEKEITLDKKYATELGLFYDNQDEVTENSNTVKVSISQLLP